MSTTHSAVSAPAAPLPRARAASRPADRALGAAAQLWFVTALVGQWTFLYYIAAFYDAATLRGDFRAWSRNTFLLNGYVPGDVAGNVAFGAHVLLASLVTFAGALQLVAPIRARWPALHRWNGRVFIVTAMIAAASGLYMIWIRGSRANLAAGLATSGDAALIIACAALAWRRALARDVEAHRRWGLRTWIVANGVWFQRIGIFGWTAWHHAPVGMTPHFDGWFDLGWAFGCYLMPLALLEAYLRVREHGGPGARVALACGLAGAAAAMAFGIHAAYAFVWHPAIWRLGG